MVCFGPLQTSGGVTVSNSDFTYLSIHATKGLLPAYKLYFTHYYMLWMDGRVPKIFLKALYFSHDRAKTSFNIEFPVGFNYF